MAFERAACIMRRAGHSVAKINRLDPEAERARLDPCHIEQIDDEAVEPCRLPFDRGDQFRGDAVMELGGGGHHRRIAGDIGALNRTQRLRPLAAREIEVGGCDLELIGGVGEFLTRDRTLGSRPAPSSGCR